MFSHCAESSSARGGEMSCRSCSVFICNHSLGHSQVSECLGGRPAIILSLKQLVVYSAASSNVIDPPDPVLEEHRWYISTLSQTSWWKSLAAHLILLPVISLWVAPWRHQALDAPVCPPWRSSWSCSLEGSHQMLPKSASISAHLSSLDLQQRSSTRQELDKDFSHPSWSVKSYDFLCPAVTAGNQGQSLLRGLHAPQVKDGKDGLCSISRITLHVRSLDFTLAITITALHLSYSHRDWMTDVTEAWISF